MTDEERLYHRTFGPLPDGVIYKCPASCGCNELVSWLYNENRKQYHTQCKKHRGGHWVNDNGVKPQNIKYEKDFIGLFTYLKH
jgi:hypothetical protein